MLKSIFFLSFFLFSILLFSQCNVEELFYNFNIGDSKMNTSIQAGKDSALTIDQKSNEVVYGRWSKPEYLNGDSIYRSFSHYIINDSNCYGGKSNKLQLRFVNDQLYGMQVGIFYSPSQITKFEDDYGNIYDTLKSMYPIEEKHFSLNQATKEKIAEGSNFYQEKYESLDSTKHEVSVEYLFIYKHAKTANGENSNNTTGTLSSIKIIIDYLNIENTVLNYKNAHVNY